MSTEAPPRPRFTVLEVTTCSCGATRHLIEWLVGGEQEWLHHGTWPMHLNLTMAERELLWAGIPVGGR